MEQSGTTIGSEVEGVISASEKDPIVSSNLPKYGTSSDSESSSGSSKGTGERHTRSSAVRSDERTCFQKFKDFVMFWKKENKGPSPPRTVYFLQPDSNQQSGFCNNRISTTKYNLLTFFPFFLFDQFRRYANLFFLGIALLQQIPGVSPTGRFTTVVPLFLVLLATAVKEIIEDVRRYRADNQVNNSKVEVLRPHPQEGWSSPSWIVQRWYKVVVGDIVKVSNKTFFPADLLLLSSSDSNGISYVETSNLDGETNLKIRQAHVETKDIKPQDIRHCTDWRVECEGPNSRLYEFTGNLHIAEAVYPLQADQILLRGSQLRNTSSVLGLVIYTGRDSKLMRNATRAPLKRSKMDRVINFQVIGLFIVLLILAVLSSIFATTWNAVNLSHLHHWYLDKKTNVASEVENFFKSIVTFIILYNNLIPISLIVTLEIMKIVQAYFINSDVKIYHGPSDTRALARNSNLNEELGQVKYVFSDKTGTLTENIMVFKHCFVGNQVYSMNPPKDGNGENMNLKQALRNVSKVDKSVQELEYFMLVLALCHTVIPETENGKLVYRASSPDEEALVKAARDVKVVFKARTPSHITIDVRGQERKYEILNLLEFNSDRKRMSVVVRMPSGKLKLFCKGADTVIKERLATGQDEYYSVTDKQLEVFGADGLRTLCIAEKDISDEFYESWNRRHVAASIVLVDREKALDAVAEEMEKNLVLLGATAIEDKLQDGVPEAIAKLKEAGMKVWVLTGDKQETAINIGFACRQLTRHMALLDINGNCEESVGALLQEHAKTYQTELPGVDKESNAALIINGKTLSLALTEANEQHFLNLALTCKAVICCRVSPLQKAQVVQLVQKKCKNEVTLAIGDGANDVGMIQAAHIGVGISGREGLQATLASDYAIAQFRFLVRLLLVHGAWNYNRQAIVILFSFYKNIVLYIIEFWFAFFNGFSGQPLFERWTIGLYNVLFTALAPFSLGFFEQDLRAEVRMENPTLYKSSQAGRNFNTRVFWKWVGFALFHSVILFFGICLVIPQEVPFSNGDAAGLWYSGNIVYTAVVITVNLKIALESYYWPWMHHLAVWGSIILWFLFVLVYSHFWPTFPVAVEMVGIDFKLYGSFLFYCMLLFLPLVAIYPDLLIKVVQSVFFPTPIEQERLNSSAKSWSNIASWGSSSKRHHDRGASVSYSVSQNNPVQINNVTYSDMEMYGDGLNEDDRSALVVKKGSRGYAFAQEDHDSSSKGTKVQRRSLIKMYGTKS